jgi:hypothetical protein
MSRNQTFSRQKGVVYSSEQDGAIDAGTQKFVDSTETTVEKYKKTVQFPQKSQLRTSEQDGPISEDPKRAYSNL